jgi:sugar phosphate isomerase/epimerase
MSAGPPRIGLVAEAMSNRPLNEVMDWLRRKAPEITDLEIGTGGYAPTTHCDLATFLRDNDARRRWLEEISARGFRVAALNAWGNPLHPDQAIAAKHASDLRNTIRLAAELGIDRVVALAGCPAGTTGDRSPNFAAGGWLPYLEGVSDQQWEEHVIPYWTAVAEFAQREHPDLLVCIELHPGTVVFNVETFERLGALGRSIAANLDPSHFFWMGMSPVAVVRKLGRRVGHLHAKDVAFSAEHLALNGLLDRRWPKPAAEMPWNFAVIGRGQEPEWWHAFVSDVVRLTSAHTLAIEHEDPFVDAEDGIVEAAALLSRSLASG